MNSYPLINIRLFTAVIFCAYTQNNIWAQNNEKKWMLNGNFQTNTQFFDRDDAIGANTLVYRKQKSSNESWLFTKLNYGDWNFSLRYDLFNNSPLLNPQGAYSNQGLAFYQISKDIDNLNITVGHFYDQFGSGSLFRSYEDRNIGIDYAIRGARLKYNFNDKIYLKAFTGQQRGDIENRFGVFEDRIQGLNLEGDFNLLKNKKLKFLPGASVVNKTHSEKTMNRVAAEINSYKNIDDRFANPKYNTFGFNAYATLNYGNFTLNGEYCHKTLDLIRDLSLLFRNRGGDVYYGTLSYGVSGINNKWLKSFGANIQYKKIDKFEFRINPYASNLDGFISYLPSITRANTYRLLARYTAVVQTIGDEAIQGDVTFGISENTNLNFNYSNVRSLAFNGDAAGKPIQLFEELYAQIEHTFNKKWKGKFGLQKIFYNQERYEFKPGAINVTTFTPFTELTFKYQRKKSFRFEFQYLETKQDLGSFLNAVLEWNIAPKYSFSITDMINTKPYRSPGSSIPNRVIHYPTVFASYTLKASVFTLAYIKQVQGVNCTGGICRVEPAFSGIRFTMNSNF